MLKDTGYFVDDLQPDAPVREPAFLIYCVGYESRSAFVSSHSRWSCVASAAIVYRDRQVVAFDENLALAKQAGHELWSDERVFLERAISEKLSDLHKLSSALNVCIDVSAMDRGVMASVLLAVISSLRSLDSLELVYAPSAFVDRESVMLPIRRYGAVHPALAGRLTEPMPQTCLILGLGFEYGVALSILDANDPDYALIYVPVGLDPRFDEAVRRANFDFDLGNEAARISHYPLRSMRSLSDAISSVITPIKHSTKIVMAPFGPKIFSAVCILHAILHRPDIAVLRYSVVTDDLIEDVIASGDVVGLVLRPIVKR